MMDIKFNEFQTQLDDPIITSLPEECKEQLYADIENIPYIKWLVSPNRPRAKDLERDELGRIKVDLARPHIIENMDYFRQAALHFQKEGCYTFLKPNSNPNSEYRKFWDEEIRRCREGYVREEDGEWVTGLCYYYLNYSPIILSAIVSDRMAVRKEDLPEMWEGIYLRFHYLDQSRKKGKHSIELAKRGCSKSYSLASIMSHNLILGENAESCRRINTILTAYTKEYLSDKDGTLSKFEPMINHCFSTTPFPHLLLKNSPNQMVWQMGYKDEYDRKKGSLNSVMGVSSKDDEGKLRGKRGWILIEEMGSFPNLLSIYDTIRYGVEEGDYTFGIIYLVGTAAEDESDFTSAKTLLYYTEAYNINSIENVYDRPKQGKPTFGYFFPAYLNRKGCYNKDGVSDIIKALAQIYKKRWDAKYSADPKSLLRVIAEMPITPAEAIIQVKASYFPTTALTERLSQLDTSEHSFDDVYVGDLVFNAKNEVEFKISSDIPIRKYGVDNSTLGAIEIFSMPEKNRDGKVFNDRYIIGHDPVDNDQANSNSLSSTIVLDLWTDRIVAEYTGRQPFAEDNYEILRKLCLFYNARALIESNKKGWFSYFSKMNSTYLLAETPEYLRDKQLIKYASFGSNKYGVNASIPINDLANRLIKDWLLKPVPTVIKENGIEKEETVQNLFFIKNRALLEELIVYTPDLNVDRIRALGMAMLYREEKMILYQGNFGADREEKYNKNKASNDSFFTRNYDLKFKKL